VSPVRARAQRARLQRSLYTRAQRPTLPARGGGHSVPRFRRSFLCAAQPTARSACSGTGIGNLRCPREMAVTLSPNCSRCSSRRMNAPEVNPSRFTRPSFHDPGYFATQQLARRDEVTTVIDGIRALSAGSDPALGNLVEPQHVGLIGWSFGGDTSLWVRALTSASGPRFCWLLGDGDRPQRPSRDR
jgi:hypothetical protein